MTDIGVAVVGAGRISAAHAPAISAAPGAILAGVFDSNTAAAQKLASTHAVRRVFASWHDLLDSPDVQVVAVLLPHHLHCRFAIEALRNGKHVVVEKPFATSLAEADQMLGAAAQAGRHILGVQNRVYDPGIELAKELVTSGAIGDLFLAQTAGYESDAAQRALSWLRADQQGVLLVQSIHEAYLLRWLAGDVRAVTCHYARTSTVEMAGAHTAVVGLEFESGAIGEMTATFAAVHGPSEHSVTLFGSAGYVQALRRRVPGEPRPQTGRRGFAYDVTAISPRRFGDSDAHTLDVADGEAFHRMWADFVSSICTGTPPRVGGHDSRQALEVMLAADQAARTGSLVSLPL